MQTTGKQTSLARLELGTHLQQPPEGKGRYWVVKYHHLAKGYIEAGFCQLEDRPSTKPKRKKTTKELNEEHIARAVRRAKTNLRRKVMASGADHLLTLTYRENKTDVKEAWQDWQKFAAKLKRTDPNFKYTVVAEKQKRGAIHFHVAVVGFQNVRLLRNKWLSIVGEGNIDVQHRKGSQLKRLHIVNYLTKYITKEFNDLLTKNKKRYRSSHNIEWETRTFYLPPVLGKISPLITIVFEKLGEKVLTWWESEEGKPIGYAASYR